MILTGRRLAAGIGVILALLVSLLAVSPAQADTKRAEISGVVAGADGQPIEADVDGDYGTVVLIKLDDDGEVDEVEFEELADDGSYSFTGLKLGDYKVWFVAFDGIHLDEFWGNTRDIEEAAIVTLADAERRENLDVELELGGWIEGEVTGVGGKKLKADRDGDIGLVEVHALDAKGNELEWGYAIADIQADGTYRVGPLGTGTHKVEFYSFDKVHESEFWDNKRTWKSANTVDVVAPVGTTDVNATLEYAAKVSVKPKAKKKRKVDFSVTVKANKKAASGKVAVYRGNKKIKTVKLNKKGKATIKISKQPKGKHTYEVRYLGSTKAAPSTKRVKVTTKK